MVSSEQWRFQKHTFIVTALALVAGYADVISIVRFKAFAGLMTGNVVLVARVIVDGDMVDQHLEIGFYVFIILCFYFGAFIQRLCELWQPNRGGSIVAMPLSLAMLVGEIVFFASGLSWQEAHLDWTVAAAAMLFGVVASSCIGGRTGTHTTMVTGHILSLGGLLANFVYKKTLGNEEIGKLVMSLTVIAGTLVGALLGAWATSSCNERILLFPVPLALVLLLFLHDHLAKPQALIKEVQKIIREKAKDGQDPEEAQPPAEGESDISSRV
mmetsp:Transcript_45571/g.85051  ORF Transcript_45571/g.85051 Transcript_45571/m.85051 type:complete len:270 (+) Transcript_45571:90-899(+)